MKSWNRSGNNTQDCHGVLSFPAKLVPIVLLQQGIKVKDAASKRAAREAVAARREVSGMELDDGCK